MERQQHLPLLHPEYDALAAEFAETGVEQRAAIAKRMNDLLIADGALIPLIHRGEVAARSRTLGGVAQRLGRHAVECSRVVPHRV